MNSNSIHASVLLTPIWIELDHNVLGQEVHVVQNWKHLNWRATDVKLDFGQVVSNLKHWSQLMNENWTYFIIWSGQCRDWYLAWCRSYLTRGRQVSWYVFDRDVSNEHFVRELNHQLTLAPVKSPAVTRGVVCRDCALWWITIWSKN